MDTSCLPSLGAAETAQLLAGLYHEQAAHFRTMAAIATKAPLRRRLLALAKAYEALLEYIEVEGTFQAA